MNNNTRSERLEYSNLSEADLHDLFVCLSNPQITQSIYWLKTPFTHDDAELLLRRAMDDEEAYWLAARRKSDGKYIGNINIHKKPNNQAEIGYWIVHGAWNKGYATEMVKHAVLLAKNMDDTHVITATTAIGNLASQSVLEKNGFRFEQIVQSTSVNNHVRESKLFNMSVKEF